jgi:hypothetical protein
MMKTCSFCGKEKKDKSDAHGPRVILLEADKCPIICNHCVYKAMELISDPAYKNEKVILINSPLTPLLA